MYIARYKKKNGKWSSMRCDTSQMKWVIETQYRLFHEFGVWMPYGKWKTWYRAKARS